MKKLVFSLLFMFTAVLSFAQDGILITLEGQTTDISGQTHTMTAPGNLVFDVPFHVVNSTGQSHNWVVTRYRVNVPTGWTDALCWGSNSDPFGGQCYTSGQMSTNPWTSPQFATVADSDFGKLKAQIDPDDFTSGQAHYRYYISDDGAHSYSDSVDLIIDFVAAVKPIKEELTVSIVPNPASDYINITVNGIDNASLKIVDMVGNVVYRDMISNSKAIVTSNFKTGVYFVTIDAPGSKSLSRKILIRH